jgi:phosphoketolase
MSQNAAVSHAEPTDFLEGIQYFGAPWSDVPEHAAAPVIAEGQGAMADPQAPEAAVQVLQVAEALRYLTLQVTGAKASGHPGGFASGAEAFAALLLLGHTQILTEVGHHAPGFYSSLFLDGSLDAMGIRTVQDLRARFRERHGLLGHLSGAIPGVLAPAGPLGQGQHFAMAAALLHPGTLFPVTIGDGGLGEPYVLNSMLHFHTAYPNVTNFLPVLYWNGFSQEHHAMCANWTHAEMIDYWRSHGFREVFLVDAADFAPEDSRAHLGPYADSTTYPRAERLAFTRAVLLAMQQAADAALNGRLSVFILKQLKGAGVHARGAKSHNLYPKDTLDQPHIAAALQACALDRDTWHRVRLNLQRAGGGSAGLQAVTEREFPLTPLPELPFQEFLPGQTQVPSTAFGALVAAVGKSDSRFVVANADGNEASGMKNINEALGIRHPTADALYHQHPSGQVYEPLNEDACAGLVAGLALLGSRSLWLSYESFAINGWPIVQTVTQAMAELRRPTPALICMFTAGALEQGRNGWTHQRPEIENYFAAMLRNGNFYSLFPTDANVIQAAYAWALQQRNKGVAILASKSPLPVHTTLEQAMRMVEEGAGTLYETPAAVNSGPLVVFAVTGDMVLLPVLEARTLLESVGYRVRVVSIVNPRRLYRPGDIAWQECAQPDGVFQSDARFAEWFSGDAVIGVTGGASGSLEPILLRATAPVRDLFAWKRGETTASPAELFALNGMTATDLVQRVQERLPLASGRAS